jgi:hypothetical protein
MPYGGRNHKWHTLQAGILPFCSQLVGQTRHSSVIMQAVHGAPPPWVSSWLYEENDSSLSPSVILLKFYEVWFFFAENITKNEVSLAQQWVGAV